MLSAGKYFSSLRKAPLLMSHERDKEIEAVERKKGRAQKRRRWESLFRDGWRSRSPRPIYGHYTKGNNTHAQSVLQAGPLFLFRKFGRVMSSAIVLLLMFSELCKR